jgi:trans-2,3-dihydro-3-hydroxyanthranilate isomerase
MPYRCHICDVFTESRFGGNQLVVFPDARGLSTEQMQLIAREFHFSEATFVLPPEAGHTRRVRIFTPTQEVPFAGHPNIGTAFVLAATGELGPIGDTVTVRFEELAGVVPVTIERRQRDSWWCELTAPQPLSLGPAVAAPRLAAAVGLTPTDIVTAIHPPTVASVGLPFVIAEMRDRETLARAAVRLDGFEQLKASGVPPDVHLYVRSSDDFDLRARMFAPLDQVPEDPATGSANCALAGLLAFHDPAATGQFKWRIAQGVEMGRPSTLEARADKREGRVTALYIGGSSVMVSDGTLVLD